MNYFTYSNSIKCILNQLILWSEISSEHPIFISTLANLTNKNLSNDIIRNLSEFNSSFLILNKRCQEIREKSSNPQVFLDQIVEIREIIDAFLLNDKDFIKVIKQAKDYEKNNTLWQKLLSHIEQEQKFMDELLINIKSKIG